jgi:hypothetical protein
MPNYSFQRTIRAMAKKREPIGDLIDAHVWMRQQKALA